jgi:hypothetical protein
MKTIEEKNRMISEFMGYETYEHTNSISIRITEGNEFNSSDIGHVHTKFHTSWDWLMPVIEKIERLGFTVEKNFQPIDNDWQCLVVKGNDILFQEFNEQSIQAMHYVVVEFIEMYNQKN